MSGIESFTRPSVVVTPLIPGRPRLRFLEDAGAGAAGGATPSPADAAAAAKAATDKAAADKAAADKAASEKQFQAITSQADLDRILGERLSREREKYAGFDDLKAKAGKYDELEEQKKSDLQKEQERAAKAEQASKATAAELLQLRAATEHGITKDELPLLTGQTAEDLEKQVAAILKLRAPGTASARDADITGGGKPAGARAKSLADAVAAKVKK